MGCGPSQPKVKRTIIIGGGYAGAYLAYLMQQENYCQVTLIDPKDSFLHRIAVPRCIVEPEFLKKTIIPYKDFIKDHVQDSVTLINRKKSCVVLASGKKMPFDFLVICTGQKTGFPLSLSDVKSNITRQEAINLYKTINDEMKRSPEIVIVGGSVFGVEIAGEIRTDYPDKKVSIVHNKENLITDNLPDELQKELKDCLDRKEVELFLDTAVANTEQLVFNKYSKEQKVITADGKEIVADLVINCELTSYETELCKKSQLELSLDSKGAIVVDNFLQVKSCPGMYAIGDVVSVTNDQSPETHKAQAQIVHKNIKAVCMMDPELQQYEPSHQPVLVTIGRYSGVGFENGKILDEFEVLERKSGDVFSNKMWKDLGLTPPVL